MCKLYLNKVKKKKKDKGRELFNALTRRQWKRSVPHACSQSSGLPDFLAGGEDSCKISKLIQLRRETLLIHDQETNTTKTLFKKIILRVECVHTGAGQDKNKAGTPKIRPLWLIQVEEGGLEINKNNAWEKQERISNTCKLTAWREEKMCQKWSFRLWRMVLPLTVKEKPDSMRITAQLRTHGLGKETAT